MKIRKGTISDAPRLAEVHVRSWQKAYRGLIPDDYLDGLDADIERREGVFREAAEAPSEQGSLFVAEEDGKVVGFVWAGPTQDEDAKDRGVIGEIWSMYVHPSHWGEGAGKVLQSRAMEDLKEHGFREAILWVLDSNERTRRWYERQGWHPDGATKRDDRADFVLNEVRYRRALT